MEAPGASGGKEIEAESTESVEVMVLSELSWTFASVAGVPVVPLFLTLNDTVTLLPEATMAGLNEMEPGIRSRFADTTWKLRAGEGGPVGLRIWADHRSVSSPVVMFIVSWELLFRFTKVAGTM